MKRGRRGKMAAPLIEGITLIDEAMTMSNVSSIDALKTIPLKPGGIKRR